MQTALMKAIEKAGTLPLSNEQLFAVRDMLTALLPTERKIIENAFKEGFGNWIEPSDYFTTKFNTNDTTKS